MDVLSEAQPLLNRSAVNRLLVVDEGSADLIILDRSSGEMARDLIGREVRRVALGTQGDQALILMAEDEANFDQTGVSALYLGLGLATWRKDEGGDEGVATHGVAPLVLCAVRLIDGDEGVAIERTGAMFANPALIDRLGIEMGSLPADPLLWTLADLSPYGVEAIAERAVIAAFDAVRWLQVARLDENRYPAIARHRFCRAMVSGVPYGDHRAAIDAFDPAGEKIYGVLDGTQIIALRMTAIGANCIIKGGPGTGKTRTLCSVMLARLRSGRPVLFMGGRGSAIQAMLQRLGGGRLAESTLHLYGSDCHPRALAERYGVEARETVAETLRAVPLQRRGFVVTTPEAYALHAPPEWSFSMLVVDEASLVPLVEVLPAIAASAQVVIVGDIEQMRKSSAFDAFDAPAYSRDMRTLFDTATKAGFYRIQLSTHYRSRHPSLIHLSNAQFYEGRMLVCPSPAFTEWLGFHWQRVEGVMDPEALTNAAEAEAVVDQIAHHIEAGQTMSVGVIAMTQPQANLIARRIRERELDLSSITGRESLLVVDYAGVQGLERDVILISTVVSRDPGPDGKTLDFGPLTCPEDGPRIINVIATRSREMIRMFTSFSSEDVPVGRSLEHMMLFNLMVYVKYGFHQTSWSPGSVFDAIAKRCGWRARDYRVAYGLFDPKTGEAGVLVYVTGRLSDGIDACFAQNYRDNRWTVHEISDERARSFEDDPEAQAAFAAELIAFYRPDYDPEAEGLRLPEPA